MSLYTIAWLVVLAVVGLLALGYFMREGSINDRT
jgi:cytochrome b561